MRPQFLLILASLAPLLTAATGCANRDALADPGRCELDSSLGKLNWNAESAALASASREAAGEPLVDLFLASPLADGDDPPLLTVAVSAGHGAFAGGIASGRYPLRGQDTDPVRCSLCVTVVGPLDDAGERPRFTYAGRSGTLRLEIDGTGGNARVRGKLSDVRLRQVEFDRRRKRYTPRSCSSRLSELNFDLPLELLASSD